MTRVSQLFNRRRQSRRSRKSPQPLLFHLSRIQYRNAQSLRPPTVYRFINSSHAVCHLDAIAMDPSLASAAPLTLPPATLHFPLSSHPDSDEHRQKDKHRTARELEPLSPSQISQAASSPSHNAEQRSPNIPLRPPYTYPTYPRNSFGSPFLRARAQRRQSGSITTASDDEWEAAATQNRLRRQTPHWYDGIVKWWNTQICVTIDEGQHRDHLGRWGFIPGSVKLDSVVESHSNTIPTRSDEPTIIETSQPLRIPS
jgi:hypothetical protein